MQWKSGRWPGMIGQRGAAYQHIYTSWQYLTHSEDLTPNQQHCPHLWIAVQWFEYCGISIFTFASIYVKWGKSTEKSVFEKLEWEDFNNRWPPDCDSGHAPWSGSGVRLTSACGAPSLVRLWPLWPVMRTNCQEDHQHSLTGSCSAFTTFIIRCLSLAHWSHEAHTSVSHSQEVFAVQPFLARHNGFPSRGAGLGPVCVE